MKVRVTKQAQVQFDRAALWWDQNRPLAPEALDEELAEAFSLLSTEPGIGSKQGQCNFSFPIQCTRHEKVTLTLFTPAMLPHGG